MSHCNQRGYNIIDPCAPCNPCNPCSPCGPSRSVTTWKINYLVSNLPNTGAHLDSLLVNPWGIAIYNNQLWVVNGVTDTITNYDLFGNKLLGAIVTRDAFQNSSHPTGIAINCGGGFSVSNGESTRSSKIITSTEHGSVHAFNPVVNSRVSFTVLNMRLTGLISVYKGIAVVNNTMYLADFFQRRIDVFDSEYNSIQNFLFIDSDMSDPIPLDYGPYNIVHIGQFLYVLWARKDPNTTLHTLEGPGHGFISVFNLDGSFAGRFTSRGVLNSPWGMIPAPCECGFPAGSMLVANNGDGRINVFDCNGSYIGPMLNQSGIPIHIEGIRGLAPLYTLSNEIYFTSAPSESTDGVVGSIVKDQVINF